MSGGVGITADTILNSSTATYTLMRLKRNAALSDAGMKTMTAIAVTSVRFPQKQNDTIRTALSGQ